MCNPELEELRSISLLVLILVTVPNEWFPYYRRENFFFF